MTPTDAQIRSACLSYRHDFGLLSDAEQETMMRAAWSWFSAWQKGLGAPAITEVDVDLGMLLGAGPGPVISVVVDRRDQRIQDLLEANNRYLARARAAERAHGLFGPLGYLVVHPDLREADWSLQNDPVTTKDEADGFVSVPLFAVFADLPPVVVERVVSAAMNGEDSANG